MATLRRTSYRFNGPSPGVSDRYTGTLGGDVEVLDGAQFVGDPSVPVTVAPNQDMFVTGRVKFVCEICFGARDIRVKGTVENPRLGRSQEAIHGPMKMKKTEVNPWDLNLPAIGQKGDTLFVTLEAQRGDPDAGQWVTDDVVGPVQVEVVSEEEAAARNLVDTAVEWAPWVAGGGVAGWGLHQMDETIPQRQAIVAGAIGGTVTKPVADTVLGIDQQDVTTTLALAAGGIFAVGWSVNQVNELLGE